MKFKNLITLLILCLSPMFLIAQDTTTQQEASTELMNASRLIVPDAATTLDPSAFPRMISPQDIALTTGNVLFHFTAARFQLADTGPDSVDFILEGYIANYSNSTVEFFDGDFRLIMDANEQLPNGDIMNRLKSDYETSRDYPGRNIWGLPRLNVESHKVKFIYLAYRIPSTSRDIHLRLSYQNGNNSTMRLLLIPADDDGTSDVEIYKLVVDETVQYRFMEQIEGEATVNGLATNITNPFRYDNCSREVATINYESYSSSEEQRLESFELSISPETETSRFFTIFGAIIYAEKVEERLFELNYRRFESSREMISQSIQAETTVRAFTAFHYRVLEQPMQRIDTFRISYGTEILELPYVINYSTVNIETYQEDITTEYCASRSQ